MLAQLKPYNSIYNKTGLNLLDIGLLQISSRMFKTKILI